MQESVVGWSFGKNKCQQPRQRMRIDKPILLFSVVSYDYLVEQNKTSIISTP
jgi:hypothetical protein